MFRLVVKIQYNCKIKNIFAVDSTLSKKNVSLRKISQEKHKTHKNEKSIHIGSRYDNGCSNR